MKLIGVFVFLLSAGLNAAFYQTASSPLASLIETERAFAAMSEKDGMRAAFLAYLADDGVLFRQEPVNGKALWEKRSNNTTARLEWEPTFADIAASGDVGYTTGPWTFTSSPNLDQPPTHGYFVSIWAKQKDGKWKLSVDLGIDVYHPEKIDRTFVHPEPISAPHKRSTREAERSRLKRLESEFSQLSQANAAAAFRKHGGKNLRLYRQGAMPSTNLEQALAMVDASGETLSTTFEHCTVASSCDLAFTYGRYISTSTRSPERISNYFLRIWRRGGSDDWKVVLDILHPPPPPSK